MKRLLLLVFACLAGVLLAACGSDYDQDLTEEQEGVIAAVDKTQDTAGLGHNDWYAILVIPDIDDSSLSNQSEDELTQLASEKDGSYYGVKPEMYNDLKLEIGTQVNIHWNGHQGDSDPPVRDAGKIEVLSKVD